MSANTNTAPKAPTDGGAPVAKRSISSTTSSSALSLTVPDNADAADMAAAAAAMSLADRKQREANDLQKQLKVCACNQCTRVSVH